MYNQKLSVNLHVLSKLVMCPETHYHWMYSAAQPKSRKSMKLPEIIPGLLGICLENISWTLTITE